MTYFGSAPPRDSGLNSEVFAFIGKLLPLVDVVNFVLVVSLSTRPFASLAVSLAVPLIGVGGMRLAERFRLDIVKPQMCIIAALHFLNCSIAGPQSPAWLMCIPGLVASVFLMTAVRWKIALLCALLVAAAWGNYLSGKDTLTIVTVTVALGGIAVLLLRTHQFLSQVNERLEAQNLVIANEREKSKTLLLNILPANVIAELTEHGKVKPTRHGEVTVLFTDLAGFTQATAAMPADSVVAELNDIFSAFDEIAYQGGIEKIKTIGDAYMAVAGLSEHQPDHAERCARVALRFQSVIAERNLTAAFTWNLRVGLHSGSVVSGVVGERKYAFDVWGDTVNIAARMESSGEVGKVNVSADTHALIRATFACTARGKLAVKGKGELEMYFVNAPLA